MEEDVRNFVKQQLKANKLAPKNVSQIRHKIGRFVIDYLELNK